MEEIVDKLDSGQLTLLDDEMMYERSYLLEQIANVTDGPLVSLSRVIRSRPALFWDYRKMELNGLLKHNGAISFAEMSYMKYEISRLPASECMHYHLTPIIGIVQPWLAVMVSRHFRHLHELNVDVMMRMQSPNFTQHYDRLIANETCREHFFPTKLVDRQTIEYRPLTLQAMSGLMIVTIGLMAIACGIGVVEVIVHKNDKAEKSVVNNSCADTSAINEHIHAIHEWMIANGRPLFVIELSCAIGCGQKLMKTGGFNSGQSNKNEQEGRSMNATEDSDMSRTNE